MNAHVSSWSNQQIDALNAVNEWISDPGQQVFRLFGNAGTGKTTLARQIAQNVDGYVHFGAFTGKAAQVLRRKGCSDASTLHSMIYRSKTKEDGTRRFYKKSKKEFDGVPLIIIDECSMVNEDMGKDLLSFGVPILVLGDPGQLPPIRGGGFFTDHNPDFMLDEVHRQAADNPIIELSIKIRNGEKLKHGDYGAVKIISKDEVDTADVLAADQVLCGLNRTRESYNRRLRDLSGRSGDFPVEGDRLVCLKNNRDNGLFNGSLWSVLSRKRRHESHQFFLQSDETDAVTELGVDVLDACWDGTLQDVHWADKRGFDEFTYGYALTVHKSQGSQWDNVYLFDESFVFKEDRNRHLYTGLTRAAETITIVQ